MSFGSSPLDVHHGSIPRNTHESIATNMNNGLEVVYEPDFEITSDIVFVHGLGGGPVSTWFHKRNERFWPSGLQNLFPASRVLTYGYAADFAGFFPSPSDASSLKDINHYATVLLDALAELRRASDTDRKAIVFIAHSLGGLVCANALVNMDPEYGQIVRNTKGLIFMGTPFGVPNEDDTAVWADIAERFLVLYKRGHEDVRPDLDKRVSLAQSIVRRFSAFLDTHRSTDAAFFLEDSEMESGELEGSVVVDELFGVLPGHTGIFIEGDHISMCKYSHTRNDGFKRVYGKLAEWLDCNETSRALYFPQVHMAGRR